MSLVAFDSHAFVKRLTAAGMPERQAEVLAEEQTRLIESTLATKRDIADIKRDIQESRKTTHLEIAVSAEQVKTDLITWVVAALLGQTAVFAALIRLL